MVQLFSYKHFIVHSLCNDRSWTKTKGAKFSYSKRMCNVQLLALNDGDLICWACMQCVDSSNCAFKKEREP